MKKIILTVLASLMTIAGFAQQKGQLFNHVFIDPDSIMRIPKAMAMSTVPNATIFLINRFVSRNEFAYIDFRTIGDNFSHRMLWDNDRFGTNLLGHPFHGSLDYSGARVSGMNYWQCFPFVFTQSFMWEFILENEPPSINDQLATSVGGMLLGEISFRLSNSILDNSARGSQRVFREIFGTLTCPMNGVNRLITGQMWKVAPRPAATPYNTFPISLVAEAGVRYFKQFEEQRKHNWSPYIKISYDYGDPFREENCKPMDFFNINATVDLTSANNILSDVHASGVLWSQTIDTKTPDTDMLWGFFQHFDYSAVDNPGDDESYNSDMMYSIPAALGPGMIFDKRQGINRFKFELYADAVILAGAKSTYFFLKGRHYNFGFGYDIRSKLELQFSKYFQMGFDYTFVNFFTPKGYDKGINTAEQNYRTFYAMGDKGKTFINILRPFINVNINKNFSLRAESSFYWQYNVNYQFENANYNYNDTQIGIRYTY